MSHPLSQHRVLVTGASGFIGMHLIKALARVGAEVTSVVTPDRDSPRFQALPISLRRVVVDACAMGDVIREVSPRYVIHLNAYISLERSLKAVRESIQTNLLSTIDLLTASTEVKADRVILMGSCEEYGQKYCPFDPTLVLQPNSPYGASKAAGTAYASMFYGSFHLPTVVLRPSVVYGPDQSPRQLISMVMDALADNRPIDVTAGRQTRDFVYIDDVVDSIMLSLTNDAVVGGIYNVGSGEVVTVRETLEMIERITGRSGLIQYGARPYAESERFHYEPMLEETFKALAWHPSVMLEDGLTQTWKSIVNAKANHAGKTS
jgi:UDP-glucose 4-epimerase